MSKFDTEYIRFANFFQRKHHISISPSLLNVILKTAGDQSFIILEDCLDAAKMRNSSEIIHRDFYLGIKIIKCFTSYFF
jgi:hypothetical protein